MYVYGYNPLIHVEGRAAAHAHRLKNKPLDPAVAEVRVDHYQVKFSNFFLCARVCVRTLKTAEHRPINCKEGN